jgi:hypothetical protein
MLLSHLSPVLKEIVEEQLFLLFPDHCWPTEDKTESDWQKQYKKVKIGHKLH